NIDRTHLLTFPTRRSSDLERIPPMKLHVWHRRWTPAGWLHCPTGDTKAGRGPDETPRGHRSRRPLLAGLRQLPGRRPRSLLPRAGGVDARGKGGLPGVRGARPVPRVRARELREVRHLGWHERARAPAHPSPAGPGPEGRGGDGQRLTPPVTARPARPGPDGPRWSAPGRGPAAPTGARPCARAARPGR